ncbi:hypothetical protein HY383_01955 [Candidatus Daviesbacteria bacterium]|nr:hypothetical protein [Candidatus Daviesbacteria bacterium]
MIHNTVVKIALKLPGGNEVPQPPELTNLGFNNLASLISGLLNIVFYLAVFFAFYWLVWGAFQYILAQGKKEELGKAKARITWALIGLIVILLAFIITKFAAEIFPPSKGGLPF